MKQISAFIILIIIGALQLNAQHKTPDEKSIVNKQYDDKGNLIQYDSTYTWNWSSDSSFTFDFPMQGLFKGFDDDFMDSVMNRHFNQQFFSFNPFENDDFINRFEQQFNDSAFSFFKFPNDSSMVGHFNLNDDLFHEFNAKEFEQLQKDLQKEFENRKKHQPQFESDEQRREWEELMKKQQKEKEALLKKWNKEL